MATLNPDPLTVPWHAVVDDTIGGWAISNADRPVSGHNPATGVYTVGNFLNEDIARHVVELHNRQLEDR